MEVTLNLNSILQGVTIILVVWGVKGIFSLDRKLNAQNGKLGKIETWMAGHEELDNVRFHELHERMEQQNK